jgi:hypothetical protein
MITYGLFAMCQSEDCFWTGTLASTGIPSLMQNSLLVGFSPFYERVLNDPVYAVALKKMLEEAKNVQNTEINFESTRNADKMGSVCIYNPNRNNKKLDRFEENSQTFPCKLYILKALQNALLNYNAAVNEIGTEVVHQPFDKARLFIQDDSVIVEEYGFPPMSISFSMDKTGIKSFDWRFQTKSSIWQPIDWDFLTLDKNAITNYLAVLQVDGHNFTYVVQDDMDSGEWRAGISKRNFGSLESTISVSSASSVEEAKDKLTKHFNKTFNKLVEDGDPIEIGWSSEFGYDHSMFHVFSGVLDSGIFSQDINNEMLHEINTSLREVYVEMFENSYMEPKHE